MAIGHKYIGWGAVGWTPARFDVIADSIDVPAKSTINSLTPQLNANNTTGDDATSRRHHLNLALNGDFYACVNGLFKRWFPSSSQSRAARKDFEAFLAKQPSSVNKTFFRSAKVDLGKIESEYVAYFIDSFNLVSDFIYEERLPINNYLVAVDTQELAKSEEFKGHIKPDISIVAVNEPDVTFVSSDSPGERKKRIMAAASKLAKDLRNCVAVFEVKSSINYTVSHTKQVIDYGYCVSQYTIINYVVTSHQFK